jgi:hypothetical protein
VDCGVCVSMYRQTGVLAACVECCRPDCWTCATEPLQAMGQASWPGLGYMYELWSVVPVVVVLCSFLSPRSSSTSTSLLPSIVLTCLLYCIGDLRLPYCPLTSSYGSDWTHAPQLPSQTTFFFFFTSQRQHKLPSHHHITTGRFFFFLTLTSQLRPHPACTIKHSAFPPTNHKPLPKHPAK